MMVDAESMNRGAAVVDWNMAYGNMAAAVAATTAVNGISPPHSGYDVVTNYHHGGGGGQHQEELILYPHPPPLTASTSSERYNGGIPSVMSTCMSGGDGQTLILPPPPMGPQPSDNHCILIQRMPQNRSRKARGNFFDYREK
jgi:hypothetical protein